MQPGIVEAGYGSDPVGLVSGYLFEPGQLPREIDSNAAAAWLREQAAPSVHDKARGDRPFVWLHFNLAHSACERWMRAQLGLPEDFFEALRQGSHSTRIERQDAALLADAIGTPRTLVVCGVATVVFTLAALPTQLRHAR